MVTISGYLGFDSGLHACSRLGLPTVFCLSREQ
jgi:hypothetical protein